MRILGKSGWYAGEDVVHLIQSNSPYGGINWADQRTFCGKPNVDDIYHFEPVAGVEINCEGCLVAAYADLMGVE